MTIKLVHMSDLHLLNLEGATVRSLLNKRLTGGLNLLFRRAHKHQLEVVQTALSQIEGQQFDHLVVTGDLTNLSLDGEFQLARRLLSTVGDSSRLSVIPGNHDAYTQTAGREKRFESYFKYLIRSDLPQLQADDTYPFVKLLDTVAIIGLSSAVPSPPLMATGEVSAGQRNALRLILAHPEVKDRFTVVLLHHHLRPPPHRHFDSVRRLRNSTVLKRILIEGRVNLVCHGHNHRPSVWTAPHPGEEDDLIVSDCGSSSLISGRDGHHGGTFKTYDIEGHRLRRITTYRYKAGYDSRPGIFMPSNEHSLTR